MWRSGAEKKIVSSMGFLVQTKRVKAEETSPNIGLLEIVLHSPKSSWKIISFR